MQIIQNSIMQAADLVLLGFKEVRNQIPEQVATLLFEQEEDLCTVVLTDYNDEKHVFFVCREQQHLMYFRPYNEELDNFLILVN